MVGKPRLVRQNTGWKPILPWFSGRLSDLSEPSWESRRPPGVTTRRRIVAKASGLCLSHVERFPGQLMMAGGSPVPTSYLDGSFRFRPDCELSLLVWTRKVSSAKAYSMAVSLSR
jgi:hypothetical protein